MVWENCWQRDSKVWMLATLEQRLQPVHGMKVAEVALLQKDILAPCNEDSTHFVDVCLRIFAQIRPYVNSSRNLL